MLRSISSIGAGLSAAWEAYAQTIFNVVRIAVLFRLVSALEVTAQVALALLQVTRAFKEIVADISM